ncbi:hypothetical protein [uncultured Campylobacter sp.]|uniref:hypothetical protein n=1 Tax=uncultured Campylobacter sp. TaxID=218934 RepID=UPI00260CC235|nr:hypothetical protein [uncultured Campylobacter sp.]
MNTQKIMDEIGVFLDRSLLKKSKITKAEIIRFIEAKWAGDAPNMLRWLGEMDKHARSNENPPYVSDYYKGQCCLECGAEQEALEFLRKSYEANRSTFSPAAQRPRSFLMHILQNLKFCLNLKMKNTRTLVFRCGWSISVKL